MASGPLLALPEDWSGSVSLDAAGLVALADLSTIARRTVLAGTSDILDCLVLCPGLHRQQNATTIHNGESPPMAAMATGYICRVENPAMVSYLQQVSRTGQLTNVIVQKHPHFTDSKHKPLRRFLDALISCPSAKATIAYLSIVALTCAAAILFIVTANWKALGILAALMLSRLCNVLVIRQRNDPKWHGASEPGVQCDNLVLLTQDRWVRLRGELDDVKAVTSGQWLREPTFIQRAVTAIATVLVYITAALASNIDQIGKIVILVLLLISAGLLSIANELTQTINMHGRIASIQGPRISYERRLTMVSKLITEVGRGDWAVRMGLTLDDLGCSCKAQNVVNSEKISQTGVV